MPPLSCTHALTPPPPQTPGLAVVLVGTRKDSETYVRSKKKNSLEVGFQSFGSELPETATEEEVLKVGGWMLCCACLWHMNGCVLVCRMGR